MIRPQRLVDPPQEANTHKRRTTWAQEIIQGAEKYGVPDDTSKEIKRNMTHSNYVALLCDIIDAKPSNYEETIKKKEWKEATIEEC